MDADLAAHYRCHTDRNKRLKTSFFFDDTGRIHPIIQTFCAHHTYWDFPDDFLPYRVPCVLPFNDAKACRGLHRWLRQNCKHPWMPWLDCLAFVDQADAALFWLWKEMLCPESA